MNVMNERTVVDPLMVEWTPGPSIELPDAVRAIRSVVEDAGRRLLEIPDGRLEAPWPWPDHDAEVDARYGFYRLFELLEAARAEALAALDGASAAAPPGARLGRAATPARWSLHGLLLPLADADLDADPGGGEWTIRETLGHVLSSQRSYGRFTAWFLTQAPVPASPVPDELSDTLPEREEEAAGSMAEVRARLDALLDLSMERLGGFTDAQVAHPARWSGGEVTVGFRIGRWASHLREHTIQVEKTLVMLDRPTTEVERLIRMIFEAYGRLEETVFGLDAEGAQPAIPVVTRTADAVRGLVPRVVAAAT